MVDPNENYQIVYICLCIVNYENHVIMGSQMRIMVINLE
jgi:hypothetical protein